MKKNMMKKITKMLALGLCLSMSMGILTGCGGASGAKGDKKKIALVCDVAGTQVFVLNMIDGLKASAEKYGFEVVVAECADGAAYEENTRAIVQEGVDLIIGGGWQSGDAINKIATEFPDKADYALIDSSVDAENVKCISYREQEGAYLIGKIAGMVTDDSVKTFGAVHVNEGPGSWKWRYGYMEGVKSEKPDAEFIFNYVGGYNEPAKAKEYAIQQYEQGCQFINGASAGGDKGVFEAAKEKGFYSSGQDVDLTSPDNPWIVTSQIKDTYATVQYLIDQYYSGKWTTENESWGISEGTIGAVYVTHDSKNPRSDKLTDEDVAVLKETAEKIKNKEIDLSAMPEEENYNK